MLRSRWALWAGILVFPPLGLVLWWMRRGVGPVVRIAGTLGICAVAIVELFLVYGMRLEWNGALKVSGVSFETRAQRDARLEGSRARQRAEGPGPPSAPPPRPPRPPLLWRPHERLPPPLLPEPQSTSRRRIGRTSAVRIARACTQRRRSKQPGRRRACPGDGRSRGVGGWQN